MTLSPEEAYQQARNVFTRRQYKEALRILDANWTDIYQPPVPQSELGKKLRWLREQCRAQVAARQAQTVLVPAPRPKRKKRLSKREQRHKRRR